jgi:hypothetical protein
MIKLRSGFDWRFWRWFRLGGFTWNLRRRVSANIIYENLRSGANRNDRRGISTYAIYQEL